MQPTLTKTIKSVLTAISVVSLLSWQSLRAAQVDAMLSQFVGTWKGGVVKEEGARPATEDMLKIQPAINHEFLQIELQRKSADKQGSYEGKGFLTSDQGKYFLHWFDTDGAHRQYVGEQSGNGVLQFVTTTESEKLKLTLSLQKGNELEITLEHGNTLYQRLVYSKINRYAEATQ